MYSQGYLDNYCSNNLHNLRVMFAIFFFETESNEKKRAKNSTTFNH